MVHRSILSLHRTRLFDIFKPEQIPRGVTLVITPLLLKVRERYHPLFHLRKLSLFRSFMQRIDFPVSIRIEDIKHPVSVSFSRNLGHVLSGGQGIESEEQKTFLRLTGMAECRTLYDVGANIGVYSFMFLSAIPNRRVHMFEPDVLNARLLRRSIQRAGLRACDLTEAAVSQREGILTFHSDSVSGATGSIRDGDSFLEQHHHGNSVAVQVRSVSLDHVSSTTSIDPDVIKIDAEGAELSILRGAESLLAKSRPMLFFECDQDREEVRRCLVESGYRLFAWTTLKPVELPELNTVALHRERHKQVMQNLQ